MDASFRFPGWVPLLAVWAFAAPAAGTVLQGSVTGSTVPPTGTAPAVVPNGGFHIFRIGDDGSVIGDGVDEHTFWVHDFTGDPKLFTFETADGLQEATLRLTLTPSVSTLRDRAAIFGLREFESPVFDALRVGETQTVEIDLLSIYSESQILLRLFGSSAAFDTRIPATGPGQLTLGYANDAVVSFAELTLIAVPEPGTFLLVSLGLAGVAIARNPASDRA